MTPTEKCLHKLIKQIQRDTGGAVRTLALSVHLGKDPRTIRYTLVRMEAQGIIERVGKRGGWLIPQPIIVPVIVPAVELPIIVPIRPIRSKRPSYAWGSVSAVPV